LPFNSYSYLVLVALAVPLFWMLPPRARRPYVLVLSILYYASWNWIYAPLPLLIGGGAFLCAHSMSAEPKRAATALWTGVGFVVACLIIFKYSAFLLTNLNGLLSLGGRAPVQAAVSFALPLGISFYSFTAIGYLLDSRQGRVKDISFMDLALFITFWPNLIAGPIARVRELMPQLAFNCRFETAMLVHGLERLIVGLVQKNLIANSLARFVDEAFLAQTASVNTTVDNWFAALAYGLQVYFDFASYSNMAIGVAQLIGVKLPENFNYPYHAQNPADFWSRWHMTLSRWIRDYLFFPINARFGGAPVPLYMSLIGIMGVVGLWHGAGWGFVLWGLLHGLYLVAYRAWEGVAVNRLPLFAKSRMVRYGWRVITLLAIMAAWIPFRASTGTQALVMMQSLVVPRGLWPSYPINFYLVTTLVAAFTFLEPVLANGFRRLDRRIPLPAQLLLWRPLVYAFGLLLFLIFDDRDAQFIYFQF
jgi:alginate O-acetyltransferase complex protein AlgI